jgi:hypothetical protein
MAEFNDETVRELNDSIRELTEVMQSAMGITGSSMGSQKDFSKALGNASSSASVLSSRNKEVATSATNVSTANKLAAEAAYTVGKSLSTLGTATKESKDALVTLGKTLLDTREGMSKYNAALNQAASAAATGLSAFGPVGKAIGLLLKPLTMLVEQVFAFQDNLFAAKDELAKFGAVGQLTTTDIQKMGEASGYSTFEIEKYAKTVTKAGIGLVGLGGSVSQGVVEFTKLTAITKEEQYRLLSLGVTMDNFVENTADFVKLQTISGRAITEKMKTDGSLQRAAKEYTDNLLVLAALSGESVEEQKRKQDQIAKDEVVQLHNIATEAKIAELRKGNAADNAEADKLARKLDLEKQAVALAGAKLDMDAAKSLAHYLATGIITPETMKIMRGTGMTLEEFRISLSQGKDVNAKFVDGIVQSDRRIISSNTLALQTSKEYREQMGLSSTRLANINSLQDKSVEQLKKEADARIKAGLGNDEAEQNRKTALENEKKFRESIDELSKSFQKFIPTFNEFTTKMTDFVEKLGKINWKEFISDMKTSFDNFMSNLKIAGIGLAALGAGNAISKVVGDGPGGKGGPSRIGKFASRVLKGGGIAAVAGAGADIGADMAGRDSHTGRTLTALGATATGAGLGFMVGGPVGAALGGAGGALYGAYQNIFGDYSQSQSTSGAAPTSAIPGGSEAALLNLIASKESKGDYNILVGGKRGNLTTMKVSDILDFQREMPRLGFESSAVGKYQIIRSTLLESMDRAGVKPNDLFDETTQEKLGRALLEKRGYKDYLSKKITADKFADNLSMEWAALPYNTGKSYYDKVGSNKSLISRQQLIESLPKARLGGSFAGPNSGYPVMLHGAETVVPTPNPSTSLIKIEGEAAANKITNALSGMNSDALNSIMQDLYSMMEERLSAMIDKLSTSNDIQDKLLKAQM